MIDGVLIPGAVALVWLSGALLLGLICWAGTAFVRRLCCPARRHTYGRP